MSETSFRVARKLVSELVRDRVKFMDDDFKVELLIDAIEDLRDISHHVSSTSRHAISYGNTANCNRMHDAVLGLRHKVHNVYASQLPWILPDVADKVALELEHNVMTVTPDNLKSDDYWGYRRLYQFSYGDRQGRELRSHTNKE